MIALSAGHNPEKPGACFEGNCEHAEAVAWVANISHELNKLKVPNFIVPTGTLTEKVQAINARHAKAAVEIHFNMNLPGTRGCETLYHPGSKKGRLIASTINSPLASFFSPNRGIKEGWYKMDVPGVKDYDGDVEGDESIDYFLRATNCPAVIVEPDFISSIDRIRSMQPIGCSVIADALALVWRDL